MVWIEQPDLFGHQAESVGETEVERFIVWMLRQANSEKPLSIAEIQSRVKLELKEQISERRVKDWIRRLRRFHGKAVLARRGSPSGYYLCKTRAEMKEFAIVYLAQALDELETLRSMLRGTYPSLIKELKIEEGWDEETIRELAE